MKRASVIASGMLLFVITTQMMSFIFYDIKVAILWELIAIAIIAPIALAAKSSPRFREWLIEDI